MFEELKCRSKNGPLQMTTRPSPGDAVALLKNGNMRFVEGKPQSGPFGPRVAEFATDPYPFAVVLACSDARLPIETIFDQVPGNLFSVRVAGNFVNRDNIASIEFSVDILKASLVVVLGHSSCGAIRAALSYVRDGTSPPGHILELLDKLLPSVRAASGSAGDWLENAITHNVARNVKMVTEDSEIIANAVGSGQVAVIGAVYNVESGWVIFT